MVPFLRMDVQLLKCHLWKRLFLSRWVAWMYLSESSRPGKWVCFWAVCFIPLIYLFTLLFVLLS